MDFSIPIFKKQPISKKEGAFERTFLFIKKALLHGLYDVSVVIFPFSSSRTCIRILPK